MPSKANKRLAAAQKSQAKAALETPEESAPVATPAAASAPITTTTEPVQLQKLELNSESEESSAALSTPTSPRKDSTSREYAPLPPSSKLAPLPKGTEQVTTNCYALSINSQQFFKYDVNVTKDVNRPDSSATLTGSKGGDRKRQQYCSDIVVLALKKLRFDKPYAYDGASLLIVVDKLDNKKQSILIEIQSRELGDALQKTHFGKFTGRFLVEFSLNTREHEFNIQKIFTEDLKNMASGDKSLTAALQILLVQEAKKGGRFTVLEGGSQIYSHNEKKPRGIPAGVVERDGLGAGVKLVIGKSGKPEVIIVLDYKKSYFFEAGRVSNLLPLAKQNGLWKFFKGIKMGTTYSSQTFSADGISSAPIGELTASGGPLINLCAETSGMNRSQFDKYLPAIKKSYKKDTYFFAMETLIVQPDQKLAPHHGQPPRCAYPDERFRLTESVGHDALILSPNATLSAFGVKVIPTAITLIATKVDVPVIEYANRTVNPDVNNKTSWQCNKFVKSGVCNKVIIAFNGEGQPDALDIVENVKAGLIRNADFLGMAMRNTVWTIKDVSGSADQAKKELLAILQAQQKSGGGHLIYVDQSTQQWSHGFLKVQERLTGVSTQQMNFNKSAKINTGKHTFTNILLKMNLKTGGHNHNVKPRESIKHLWGADSNTLIISYDVCHGGSGSRNGEAAPSVVGFGYNVSANRQSITGDFHFQPPRQEKVEREILESRAQSIMETFMKAHNNVPPKNVIVLRDGVSEGQYRMVLGHEVVAIEKGFAECLGKKNLKMPSVAVIVATKRHANRLFVKNGQKMENVAPFLAVDHTIVRKDANEILFVSHCPLNGTSQPLLLNVLKNNGVFKTNTEIVDLMSALCAAHQASLNMVSLPETIYAADEYAKRGDDLFAALTTCGLPIPKTETGAYNYAELTRRLRYDNSLFKDRRMV